MKEVDSKAYNVFRSTLLGTINNVLIVVLSFLSRKLFLQYIGLDYLSVAQVINNLLTIVAFSELGLSNAVLYMLYKPVANDDKKTILRILFLYRRFNRYIGLLILAVGLIVMPALPMFVKTSVPISTVFLIYLINLCLIVSTYFYTYRSILLSVYQKDYIISAISSVISFMRVISQCLIIYITHDYLCFLFLGVISTLIQNLLVYYKTGMLYPFATCFRSVENDLLLLNSDKKILKNNVFSMASVRIAAIVINNTDIVLISWLNTLMVGLIANYMSVSNCLKNLVTILQNALIHSVGISIEERGYEERYHLFRCVLLVNTFIGGIVFVYLGTVWNDIIELWIGKEYIIDIDIVILLLLNVSWGFFIATIWMFRDAAGLFTKVRKMLLFNVILNLLLSIVFGFYLGISGVFLGTIIADIFTDFWYDSKLVYNVLFNRSDYFDYIKHVINNVLITALLTFILNEFFVMLGVSLLSLLIKSSLSICIYMMAFYFIYRRKDEFVYLCNQLIKLKKRLKKG